MGAWGYGLFQSDQELDTMDEISSEASKLANDPDFTFWYPENKDEVVTKLNAGLFHQLLEKFQNIDWKHGIVYLGALTMQLGASISEHDMQVLRDTLRRTPMYDEAKAQMEKGLQGYKNDGKEWNFKSPGLNETAASGPPGRAPNGLGFIGMNVMQDWSKMPEPMPKGTKGGAKTKDAGKEDVKPKENVKPKEDRKLKGKDSLGNKATLQAWFGS